MTQSKAWRLNDEDINKIITNGLLFLGPLAIIYLTSVIAEINLDGFGWEDFIPTMPVIGAMVLYMLNVVLDFFRKLTAGK